MKRKAINPETMYKSTPFGFSHAVEQNGGRTLHLAGQVAWNAAGELVGLEEDLSICDALPSCGICSHLCDPEGIGPHIPQGLCAAIVCTLTDGRVITVHGCHH